VKRAGIEPDVFTVTDPGGRRTRREWREQRVAGLARVAERRAAKDRRSPRALRALGGDGVLPAGPIARLARRILAQRHKATKDNAGRRVAALVGQSRVRDWRSRVRAQRSQAIRLATIGFLVVFAVVAVSLLVVAVAASVAVSLFVLILFVLVGLARRGRVGGRFGGGG
jgi:hypothetical protein